ncbi:hypothetical protein ACQ4LE_001855 [Meloidogyne hapla]|uniref:Uncharacterized protein n=1 Tax=Meloidogyne hapla TaxID=6305 RepID=A0A1I8B512_MELHA
MAIFFQLTSALLIISMAFIAINEGMNTESRSGSSSSTGCTKYYGKIEHMPGTAKNIVWKPSTDGEKNLVLAKGMKGLESVALQVGTQKCTATPSTPGKCQINGNSLNGQMIFSFSNKQIVVDFKQAPIFSGDKCVIEIVDYDIETHETKIKINGSGFKIIVGTGAMACKGV